jgi:hypothetical protein
MRIFDMKRPFESPLTDLRGKTYVSTCIALGQNIHYRIIVHVLLENVHACLHVFIEKTL